MTSHVKYRGKFLTLYKYGLLVTLQTQGSFEFKMDNIYTVGKGSLQMVSESIPDLGVMFVWPHNPVEHNEDVVST